MFAYVLLGLIVLGLGALCVAWEMRQQREFRRKWPAISDDEFVATMRARDLT